MTGLPPQLEEIDRLAAADKIAKMRDVDTLAVKSTPMERQRWARTFRELAKQAEAAAMRLERYVPNENEVPEWLRKKRGAQ